MTPLLIGQGETYGEDGTDIKVLKDKRGNPYIPGTSLAGIIRDKMLHRTNEPIDIIFGTDGPADENTVSYQSSLNILDVLLEKAEIKTRDGIRIDSLTGTVADHAKYDFEIVERGATGKIRMEIILRNFHMDDKEKGTLRADVEKQISLISAILREGFAVGAKTATGMGKVRCENIKLYFYDFHKIEAVKAWLTGAKDNPENAEFLYNPILTEPTPERDTFIADLDLSLRGSLLVRSYRVNAEDKLNNVSAVQMESKGDYLIPGTTVKGVLRNHAAFILRRLGIDEPEYARMLDGIMGYMPKDESSDEEKNKKIKSRFSVDEVYFSKKEKSVTAFVQRRNRIDRFTGGTVDTALFGTKPLWKDGSGAPIHIHFEIAHCNVKEKWEAGLALFLLKDLCTGKIAIGGEKSVGRGLLQGEKAVVRFNGKLWEIDAHGKVIQGNAAELEEMALNLIGKGQVDF